MAFGPVRSLRRAIKTYVASGLDRSPEGANTSNSQLERAFTYSCGRRIECSTCKPDLELLFSLSIVILLTLSGLFIPRSLTILCSIPTSALVATPRQFWSTPHLVSLSTHFSTSFFFSGLCCTGCTQAFSSHLGPGLDRVAASRPTQTHPDQGFIDTPKPLTLILFVQLSCLFLVVLDAKAKHGPLTCRGSKWARKPFPYLLQAIIKVLHGISHESYDQGTERADQLFAADPPVTPAAG